MDLLDELAAELWTESQRWVAAARQGLPNSTWMWADIVRAQVVPDGSAYHLPAPVFGYCDHPRVLLVGQNPNVDFDEAYPALDGTWTQQRYADSFRGYFEHRVDGKPAKQMVRGGWQVVHHFAILESCLSGALPLPALGRTAAYADLIPWASANLDHKLLTQEVRRAARERIALITARLKPALVIGLGNIVHDVLFGQLESPQVREFPAFLPIPAPGAHGGKLSRLLPTIQAEVQRFLLALSSKGAQPRDR